jgi:hypothetical protein
MEKKEIWDSSHLPHLRLPLYVIDVMMSVLLQI